MIADPQRLEAPLARLLVAIKDLFDEAGEITTAGSRQLGGNAPATKAAEAVRGLRCFGAMVVAFWIVDVTRGSDTGSSIRPRGGTRFDRNRLAEPEG